MLITNGGVPLAVFDAFRALQPHKVNQQVSVLLHSQMPKLRQHWL
jgi:hypothetical protein